VINRLSLSLLANSGANDDDVLTYDTATGVWAPSPSGGGGLPARPGLLTAGTHYASPVSSLTGTIAMPPNGDFVLAPFFFDTATAIDSVIANVTTGVASSTIRLGIYGNNAGLPGGLLVDAGSVAGTPAGVKSLAVSVTIPAGWFWVGAVQQAGVARINVTGLLQNGVGPDNILGFTGTGVATARLGWVTSVGLAALPATLVGAGLTSAANNVRCLVRTL